MRIMTLLMPRAQDAERFCFFSLYKVLKMEMFGTLRE